MKSHTVFALIISFLLFTSENSQGQDTPGSSDHAMITRYAGSVIDGYEVHKFNEFVLPLGLAIRSPEGNRVPSEKKLLEWKITRILYRGPEGRTTLEIFRNYRFALEGAGFQLLYKCSDKECGFLFHWLLYKERRISTTKTSGQAFDVPKDIRYLAAKKTIAGSVIHVSLLVAIDGIWTKKPVTLLEIIESKAMDTGSAKMKQESDSTIEEIDKLLKAHPSLNLLVVGHTDNQGGYDYNMSLSERRAAAVVKTRADQFGVSSKRLTAAGVGYLSPVASNDTAQGQAKNRRVELVKH